MRHPMRLTLGLAAFAALFPLAACQGGSFNSLVPPAASGPSSSPSPATPSASPPASPVPGGYFEQNPSDQAMQDIYKRAEQLLQAKYPAAGIKLTRLVRIASQVVAGANYNLQADYTDAKGSGSVTLTVFRSLQGEYSLSSDNYPG